MANTNSTSNFIFGAPERELVTLSMSKIIDGLVDDYMSFSRGIQAGIQIPDKLIEPRLFHSCILYAEGLRLAHTHLQLAVKLIMTSLFESNTRAAEWFAEEKICDSVEVILKKIEIQQSLLVEDDLLLLSIFGYHARAVKWLATNGEMANMIKVFKAIEDFEAYKTAERNKKGM